MGLDSGFTIGGKTLDVTLYKFGGCLIGRFGNEIPEIAKVQQEYLAPGKLEIQCTNFNRNGELETTMKIGSQHYLLKEVDGEPVLFPYEGIPMEIVPKSEF